MNKSLFRKTLRIHRAATRRITIAHLYRVRQSGTTHVWLEQRNLLVVRVHHRGTEITEGIDFEGAASAAISRLKPLLQNQEPPCPLWQFIIVLTWRVCVFRGQSLAFICGLYSEALPS